MAKKNRLFHPMDLVAPIGTGALAAALCVWGLVAAQELPAKVVCVLTGVVFLGMIPLLYRLRAEALKHHFALHGVRVRVGKKKNVPTRDQVQTWLDDLIAFWCKVYDRPMVMQALDGLLLVYSDKTKFKGLTRWLRGYSLRNSAVVGYRELPTGKPDWPYMQSLTMHECAHHVLWEQGLEGENAHHAKMGEVGYRH